ncbi:MAG: hypothetical protein JWO36_6737 [Myxococcales bacterium]|nr:hypothetical protein [Myxococcales bacterium]
MARVMRRLSLVVCLLCSAFAHADRGKPQPPPPCEGPKPAKGCVQTIDMGKGLDVSGQNRTAQLLYFLERANEELERASLERRSFIPRLVLTIEEEKL